MANAVRYVVFYDNGDQSLAAMHVAAHRAWFGEFLSRGVLLSVGPFADGGAMSVFTSRRAAEEFVSGDPFVAAGVVSTWRIREWRETTAD